MFRTWGSAGFLLFSIFEIPKPQLNISLLEKTFQRQRLWKFGFLYKWRNCHIYIYKNKILGNKSWLRSIRPIPSVARHFQLHVWIYCQFSYSETGSALQKKTLHSSLQMVVIKIGVEKALSNKPVNYDFRRPGGNTAKIRMHQSTHRNLINDWAQKQVDRVLSPLPAQEN
jgi:hypothetical protein